MAEGVGLALGAMLFYGLADWVYKRAAASGVQAWHFLPLQAFFFAPGIFLYGLATGTLEPGTAFAWGMAAGVLVYIAGLAAALAAVWLLLAGGRSTVSQATGGTIVRVAVATVAMGFVSLIYKLGALAGGSPATVLTGQASVFMPLATLVAVVRDRGFRPPPGAWRYGATTAALLLVGLVMLLAGLARGEASVLVPVAQLSFIVTSALGIVWLRETLTLRKLAGLACALAALVCLASG